MLAVYRGVAYDTERELTQEAQYRKVEETYRGVQHTETVKVVEVQKWTSYTLSASNNKKQPGYKPLSIY